VLPVADAALAESEGPAGVLALVLDFALGDDDGLCVGLDEGLAAAVDIWPCPGAGLVQLGLGVGAMLFLADPVELGLALLLALDDVVGVTDGEPPGLALGVPLGLTLALPDGLELALAVPPLLVLPLEDVAGAVVVAVVLLGGLLLLGVTDECVDGDGQALREGGTTAAALLGGAPPAAEGVRGVVLWPSVAGGVALEELPVMADQPASVTCRNACCAGGTTDRTTPTANTAAPMAKAGLSMASRQSLGRCEGRRSGACRRGPCRSGTRKPRRRISLAATPETPSQTPRIHRGWLACAGRDRILSRIRSRPSEPGST
jgi:hypothetical protein